MSASKTEMFDVREYNEGIVVELARDKETNRLVIRAYNEGGHNSTDVDLLDVIHWLKLHDPELLK